VSRSTPGSIPQFGVFDLETQLSAQEVGGWHRADMMRVSCAVLFDSESDTFLKFQEPDIPKLIKRLSELPLIIGFNLKRFDYKVLSAYSDLDFWGLPTLDILEDVHTRLGYRLSLDHLVGVTLGTQKTANGMQALKWWKQGKNIAIRTWPLPGIYSFMDTKKAICFLGTKLER
jgi:DEAD/DEAH box helicase domain-containing protein